MGGWLGLCVWDGVGVSGLFLCVCVSVVQPAQLLVLIHD